MKLYLAGPMTGYPEHNWPLFFRVAAELRVQGYEVVNPAERESLPSAIRRGHHECMREDLKLLLNCNGIALLPGWKKSKGAMLEWATAKGTGLNVFEVREDGGLTPIEETA